MVYHKDAGIIIDELVNSSDDYSTECGSALLAFLHPMLPIEKRIPRFRARLKAGFGDQNDSWQPDIESTPI